MKKYLAMMCAAMLCVCCLALAACGGGTSSSAAASGSGSSASASASEASSAAQPSFVGEWKFAALEYQGMTLAGDLSAVIGQDMDVSLVIKDDGTGTMSFQGESADLKWTQKDASTITLTVSDADASSASSSASASASASDEPQSIDVVMKDNALFMEMNDADIQGTIIFTPDGVYADAKIIDLASATPIKSADELVGDWTLCGVNMMGVSVYGDPASLAAIAGDTDVNASFTKDGKVTMMGEEMQFSVESDGAYLTVEDAKLPVKSLDGDIVVDLSAYAGTDIALVFGK